MKTKVRAYGMHIVDADQYVPEFLRGLFDENETRVIAYNDGFVDLNSCQCGTVGRFRKSRTYKQEILDRLNDAKCDLMDARREFPAKWCFGFASTAVFTLCKLYLYASGRHADSHSCFKVGQVLPLILGENRKVDTDYLKACLLLRNRKNSGQYPTITSQHASKLVRLAEDLYLQTFEWLHSYEPALIAGSDITPAKVLEKGMYCVSHDLPRFA